MPEPIKLAPSRVFKRVNQVADLVLSPEDWRDLEIKTDTAELLVSGKKRSAARDTSGIAKPGLVLVSDKTTIWMVDESLSISVPEEPAKNDKKKSSSGSPETDSFSSDRVEQEFTSDPLDDDPSLAELDEYDGPVEVARSILQGSEPEISASGRTASTTKTASTAEDTVWLPEDDPRVDFATAQLEQLRRTLLESMSVGNILDMKHREHSHNHIRVVNGSLEEVYTQLIRSDFRSSFKALNEPPENPTDEASREFNRALDIAFQNDQDYFNQVKDLDEENERDQIKYARAERQLRDRVRATLGMPARLQKGVDSPKDIARSQGIEPSWELRSKKSGNSTRTMVLQTLNFPRDLAISMIRLRQGARSAIQETGNNSLHAVFAFLEWYPEKRPDRKMLSPLILTSVDYDQVAWKNRRQLVIMNHGDDPMLNPALEVRLLDDERVKLPKLDAEEGITDYIQKVEREIAGKPRWKVRHFLTLGLFESSLIELWKDLDPEQWPEDKGPARHKSVATLLAGGSDRAGFTGEDYEIDSPEIQEKLPEPILDADSSQLSAIIDVLEGNDLAISGPPGTGKSQTIANLIAALMQKGKTVLFVAEKMAALDVVKSRLDDVGLGDFVLELHSTKTRRSRVYSSFKESLKRSRHRKDPTVFKERLKRLRDLKQRLNSYAVAMNSQLGSTGNTVHEAHWEERALGGHMLHQSLRATRVDDAESIDSLRRDAIVESLTQFETLERESEEEFGGLNNHPWAWVNNKLSLLNRERLIHDIHELHDTLSDLDTKISELSWAGLKDGNQTNFIELQDSLSVVQALTSDFPDGISGELLGLISAGTSLSSVRQIGELVEIISKASKELQTILVSRGTEPESDDLTKLKNALQLSKSEHVGDLTSNLEIIKTRTENLRSLESGLQGVLAESNIKLDLTVENAKLLVRVLAAIQKCPDTALGLRSEAMLDPHVLEHLNNRRNQVTKILEQLSSISERVTWSESISAEKLNLHIHSLNSGGLLRALKPSVRRARAFWKTLNETRASVTDEVIANDLRILLAATKLDQELRNDDQLKNVANNSFKALHTDFATLAAAADLMAMSSEIVGRDTQATRQIRNFVRTSPADLMIRTSILFQDYLNSSEEILSHAPITESIARSIEVLLELQRTVELGIDAASLRGVAEEVDQNQIENAIKSHTQMDDAYTSLSELDEIVQKMKAIDLPLNNPTVIQVTVDLIESVKRAESQSWPGLTTALTGANPEEAFSSLHQQTTQALTTVENYLAKSKSINSTAGATGSEGPVSWISIQEALGSSKAILDKIPSLTRWIRLAEAKSKATIPETSELWAQRENLGESHTLASAWQAIYWRSAIDSITQSLPVLQEETGFTLNEARTKLSELDSEIQLLAQETVASEISKNRIPVGVNVGSPRNKTERGLIDHVKDQKMPQVPVRDFVVRAGAAARAFKPCWMMSPSSVARYLPKGSDLFDVIIMDEASQIRAEEATGSLARARQTVIVGDTLQLPPTGFFRREVSSDDYDEEKVESILEKANQQFPQRELIWHYRSRHEDLIKFSNSFFYDNRLIVFPSATDSASNGMGVFFEHVPDALYQSRTKGFGTGGINPEQARIVAEKTIQAMIDRPDWTLGVAAVNRAQADLIENEVFQLAQSSSAATKFINRHESTLEPFFVKNLENVQGDERDHIIISTVYGPTKPGGRTMARFGPIGSEYGHRRLNVLFTRAKRRVDVVSSMASADITTSENSNEGVKALKGYLGFAATGILEGTDIVPRGVPDSDFEMEVGEALTEEGYEVHFQVGVAGYRVDIGVRHQRYPHGYLLGIECDGAMYHSGRSARDRDLLRQSHLEGLGWTIYRIWSTDWFEDPRGEMRKLLDYLETLPIKVPANYSEKERTIQEHDESEVINLDSLGSDNSKESGLDSPPPVDFEVSVGNALETAGFEVEYGIDVDAIGLGSYRLDLAVTHQDYSDGYISAIECDRVPYLESTASGQRNIQRLKRLKDLGWDIYHILSKNWFEDPDGEATKLIDHLQEKIRDDEVRWKSHDEPTQDRLQTTTPSPNSYRLDETASSELEIDFSADWSQMGSRFNDIDQTAAVDHWFPMNIIEGVEDPRPETAFQDWSDSDLKNFVRDFVTAFGPVHREVVADTSMLWRFDINKATRDLKRRIYGLLEQLVRENNLRQNGPFFSVVTQKPWGPDHPPRTAKERSITQINHSELMAACFQLAIVENISDSETLLERVANELGYQWVTKKISKRLGQIAEDCVTTHLANTQTRKLQNNARPGVGENALIQIGYDPTLGPAPRWQFLLEIGIPQFTKEGAANSLQALIDSLEDDPEYSENVVANAITDLKQLQRLNVPN